MGKKGKRSGSAKKGNRRIPVVFDESDVDSILRKENSFDNVLATESALVTYAEKNLLATGFNCFGKLVLAHGSRENYDRIEHYVERVMWIHDNMKPMSVNVAIYLGYDVSHLYSIIGLVNSMFDTTTEILDYVLDIDGHAKKVCCFFLLGFIGRYGGHHWYLSYMLA